MIIIIIIIIINKFKKINNYSELGVEIARVLNLLREVVPVVIGALGSIPKNQQNVADEDLNNPSGGRCVSECCFLQ